MQWLNPFMWFIWVDDQIVAAYEKLAHKVQKTIGYDCYTLAKTCFVGWCLVVLPEFYLRKVGAGISLAFYFFMISAYFAISASYRIRREEILRTPTPTANLRKVHWISRALRLYFLYYVGYYAIKFALLRSLLNGLVFADEVCYISWLYFAACDPLPPCRGKFWEWLGNLTHSPEPAIAESEVRTSLP